MIRLFFILCLIVLPAGAAVSQDDRSATALAATLSAIDAKDWAKAAQEIAPAGKLGKDIYDWYRLRAGQGTFPEYLTFLDRNSDWPGLPLMRRTGERSITKNASNQQVIDYFTNHTPSSGTGVLRLVAALTATGKTTAAQKEVVRAWRGLSLNQSEQILLISQYGELLKPHHTARLDALLWRERATEATRMLSFVDADHQALSRARIGLMRKSDGVDALIAAVPKKLAGDAGLAHDRFQWRSKKGLADGAISLILERSTSAEALGQPEHWAQRRRKIARQMMRDGKSKQAYRMASNHFLTEGSDYNDLEWLSGFIALTDLNDPKTALKHFKKFRIAVATPISLGRAGYWEGRAYAALGQPDNAQAAYEFGGEYQTSFYGQLAAEKAGLAMDPKLTGQEKYPDFQSVGAANSSVFKAALLFRKAAEPLLFTRFLRHLAEGLTNIEIGALAQLALDSNEPYTALYLAKYAARSGTVLMRPYFPVVPIGDGKLPVEPALALSIARRESEFYAQAVSPVGARGLMQLMPKTGQAMATKLGLEFSTDKLIEDPAFNVTLGSAYLAKLIEKFGPAVTMVAAGYNAGPSRPIRWAKRYGDPRSNAVDAVDWIEHIPFRETRNYVMRVMESVPVYRARLSGKTAPLRTSAEIKGK